MSVLCGECGSKMILRTTTKYPNKDGSARMFYGCIRYPVCTGTHGAHQNSGKPLGTPANKETKEWRMKAHAVFDPYVAKWFTKRDEGYKFLQKIMGMSDKEAHIGEFNIDQCKKLISILEKNQ